jgi:hypothetical protein
MFSTARAAVPSIATMSDFRLRFVLASVATAFLRPSVPVRFCIKSPGIMSNFAVALSAMSNSVCARSAY